MVLYFSQYSSNVFLYFQCSGISKQFFFNNVFTVSLLIFLRYLLCYHLTGGMIFYSANNIATVSPNILVYDGLW